MLPLWQYYASQVGFLCTCYVVVVDVGLLLTVRTSSPRAERWRESRWPRPEVSRTTLPPYSKNNSPSTRRCVARVTQSAGGSVSWSRSTFTQNRRRENQFRRALGTEQEYNKRSWLSCGLPNSPRRSPAWQCTGDALVCAADTLTAVRRRGDN
jgi:hypothetical protein